MKKSIKLLALLVAVAMLMSVAFVACSDNNNNNNDNNTTNNDNNDNNDADNNDNNDNDTDTGLTDPDDLDWDDTETVTWFMNRHIPDSVGVIGEALEEEFNFEFQIVGVSDETVTQQLNLLLAAGDMPDVFPTWNNQNVKDEGMASFTMEEMETYMPDYLYIYDWYTEEMGLNMGEIWARYKYEDEGYGEYRELPHVWWSGAWPQGIIWRKDVLDELGYEEPPATIQGWDDVFSAYKEAYPNKYPYSGAGGFLWQSNSAIFHSVAGYDFFRWNLSWPDKDKIVYGGAQPEMKEAFRVAADWHDRGFINPNWITNDSAQRILDFVNGDAIVHEWGTPGTDGKGGFLENTTEWKTLQVNPDAEFSYGPWPTMYDDQPANVPNWDPFTGLGYGYGIHLNEDRDKLHKLMVFENYTTGTEEGALLAAYGIEGEHWEWAETDDGTKYPERLPGYQTTDELLAINANHFHQQWGAFYVSNILGYNPNAARFDEIARIHSEVYRGKESQYIAPSRVKGQIYDEDGNNLSQEYLTHLDDKRDEYFVNIISGAEPVDAFDEWIEYFNDNGGDLLEEHATRLNMQWWE